MSDYVGFCRMVSDDIGLRRMMSDYDEFCRMVSDDIGLRRMMSDNVG